MNYPIAIVCGLMLVGFVAHMTGGVIQSLSIKPSRVSAKPGATEPDESLEKLDRNWVQAMCAFQLVSVDLIAVAGVLYLLAFSDYHAAKQTIGFAVAGLFFLWGVAWLIQLGTLKRRLKDYLLLSHWAIWFLCSGLVFWGSMSL